MTQRILVIEDDVQLQRMLKDMLGHLGYISEAAYSGVEGLQKAYSYKPDLIILDIMLPNMDGWETCRRLREMSSVPIIMLTALADEADIIKGLSLGADTYLVKPITSSELAARIKAVLRRSYDKQERASGFNKVIQHEDLIIDLDKHEVTFKQQRINLSPTEFRLLSCLAQYKGRIVSREYLLNQIWGSDYIIDPHQLNMYIHSLRKKLELEPNKPRLIHTEWGVGYRFG